jgi:hypothetical protein
MGTHIAYSGVGTFKRSQDSAFGTEKALENPKDKETFE